MQKSWYIIYTKPKCEKRIASILAKKKIENFFPLNSKQNEFTRRGKRKSQLEPLFDGYVFVHISEMDIEMIREVDGVINLVYWRGQPAVIKKDEIDVIKEFTSDYQDIKVEKTYVDTNEIVSIIDAPKYLMEGNILSVKPSAIRVNLPSLGLIMIAEVNSDSTLSRKLSFGNKELLLQS